MAAARPGPRSGAMLLLALALPACGSAAQVQHAAPTPTAIASHHVATPVRIAILSPAPNEVITATTVHVVVSVSGGTFSQTSTGTITPTVGHLHLYLDGQLVSMSYATSTDLPVDRGSVNSLYAEWVASDHLSFTPRDVTPKIYFAVSP